MSEREVHPAIAQRIIIKFLVNENVNAAEIRRRLLPQFGERTLSWPRVKQWCNEFKKGRERVENIAHPRRSRTSITPQNTEAVRELIEGDRHLTILKISQELQISYGSVQSIIRDGLGFRKVSARWVPKLLNAEQKAVRLGISRRLLTRYEEEGDAFLEKIVTCDETWVHHYTPKSKRASMEWRKTGEGAPVKAKTQLSAGKVLATVFWDCKGVLLVDFLQERQTINADYYCSLLSQVRAAYRTKRRGIPIRSVLLLHDNARPHTAAVTQQKIADMHWTVLEHPPYSPDLSPCDFHMFGPLKEALGGQRFTTNEEVQQFVCNWFHTRPKTYYKTGIKKLPDRWRKCIDKMGDYVEK